jgi:mannosyltransferase
MSWTKKAAPNRPDRAGQPHFSLLMVLLLAFGLRVFRLAYQSLWWDEIATHMISMMPLDELLDSLFVYRNHLPLYFVLMRLWSFAGRSDFSWRLFSVFWSVAGVGTIFRVGKMLGGYRVGLVSALLLAISPFHIWYSQETRMYTMVATLMLVASWLLMRLLQRDRWQDWLWYGFCLLVAAYTHYLALLVPMAHYAFFALNLRLAKPVFYRWLCCSAIVGLLFGIWAVLILSTGGFTQAAIGWIAPARWYEPLFTLYTFAAGPTVSPLQVWGYLSLAACVAALAVSARMIKGRQSAARSLPRGVPADRGQVARILMPRLLVWWLVVPIVLTWAISLDLPIPQKRSVYVDRYLITALPPFLVLVAWGWVAMAQHRKRWAAAAVLCVLPVCGLALRNMYADPAYARDGWRAAMSFLDTAQQSDDILFLRPNQTLPLVYYGDRSQPYYEFPFLFYDEQRQSFLANEMAPAVSAQAIEWRRAWLVSGVEVTNAHGFSYQRTADLQRIGEVDVIKGWLDQHYAKLDEVSFTGLVLTLYDLASPIR